MRTFLFLLVSLLAAFVPSATATVLAIDYGSDWIKASLMKPGVPFDVLLNKDSKRKIQSSVGWKKDDRLFGQDAANLASRFPADSFSSTKLLLAAPYDSPAVSYYKSISSNEVVQTERGTAALKRSDGTEWTPEELIGMEFAYVKGLAETMAGEKVQDVVVTVPPHFTQFERDAIVDAIEISGLRTLALINDGAAVAVNYAMTRNFPEEEYHIIYDAGASAIRATVVSFLTNDAGQTAIQVHGVGFDRSVGGTELDRRLREILADDFNAKHKRDIRKDKRGMAKLWKEAGRVKAILSANNDAISNVESVAWDIDFKTKVSRKALEAASSDLQSKFAQPIFKALINAGLSLDQISSVIFTGGATRTPMIQTAVKKAVGENKISLNVNADEAAVLGAALYGASLSRQFRTKDIKLTDINTHDMQVSYFAAATSPNAKPRTITTSIFPAGTKTGSKKTLTLKRKEDFRLNLDYKKESVPGFPTRILEVELSDVKEAIANLTEAGAVDPVVKATLKLSDSGFVSVSEAVAYGEVKSIAGKLKGLFTGSEDQTVVDAEAAPESEKKEPVDGEKEEEKEPVPNTIPLKLKTHFTTIPPMTVEQKKTARSRLRAIDADETAKNRREEARNTLEGYIYKLRDLLDDDAGTGPFTICSQDSERKAIARQLEETMEWMHEKADIAETSQFLDRRVALETLERPITHRYVEREAFPQALNNSQMWNWSTRLFLTDARQNLTEEAAQGLNSKWTKEELDALEKTLKEHETWLNTWVEKQKSVKQNEDPAIETTEMRARAKVLEQHLQKLYKRPAPKRAKKKKVVEETVKKEEDEKKAEETTQAEQAKETPHDEL
ncbi:actin-like ATPase domain-containing protein [Cylindrobasidium torrendii FP15055 ss-10]|uniref:Actin-like ATPase domain-containing protein n=1 Tax=Cylindrobasidium torrendii FP15055 ss-10 TaxID=1314674 RepID=A0A0D7BFA6_9AGAR|nr:actin-like ATPase domain-containing protein [Cylindrobasidium torrendii FP15055 ss-10]